MKTKSSTFALTRRLVLVGMVALFGWCMPQAHAQAGQGQGPLMQKLNSVLDKINLSSDQKSKIDDILHKAREQALQMRQELPNLSRQERMQKMRAYAMTLRKNILAVLNPTQAREFQQAFADRPQRANNGNRPAQIKSRASGNVIAQLKGALEKLKLSSDQQTKIDSMFTELQPQLTALRNADPAQRRAQVTALIKTVHQKLSHILNYKQQRSLQKTMQKLRQKDADGASASTPRPTPADMAPAPGLAVGQTAQNLRLDRLDQSPLQLSAYKGQVVAMVFGSYSCPMFRQQANALSTLAQQMSTKAIVLLVYTRESNPSSAAPIDANKQADVYVKQTNTRIERDVMADLARQKLHLTLPIVVDDASDTLAKTFGATPNGCVVLNRMGVVSARFKWFDAISTRHAIDDALASPVAMTTPAEGMEHIGQ